MFLSRAALAEGASAYDGKQAGVRPAVLSVVALLLIAGTIYQLRYFYFTTEDAWISLNYARNLAEGHGLVINQHGPHEEGFSNLSLVLLVATLGALGLDYLLAAKIVGVLSAVASALLIVTVLPRSKEDGAIAYQLLPVAIAACLFTEATVTWSTAGLETTLYGLFLTLQFSVLGAYAMAGSVRVLGLLPLAVALAVITRPEAPLFVGYTALVTFLLSRYAIGLTFRRSFERAAAVAISSIGLIAIYIAWRLWYFGEPMSNPAYVKLAVSIWNPLSERLAYILGYFADQSWLYAFLFIAGAFAIGLKGLFREGGDTQRREWMLAIVAFGFVVVQALFVIFAGADYMAHFRFMAPIAPLAGVVIAYGVIGLLKFIRIRDERLKALACIVAAIGLTVSGVVKPSDRPAWPAVDYQIPRAADNRYGNERDWGNIREIRAALMQLGSNTYAHSEFGYIPYHLPGVNAIDMIGLNSRIVAKTFAVYPIAEAARAARDYVLSEMPGVISTYGYWRDEKGVHAMPSVAWFFLPYLESRFFNKNYEVHFAEHVRDYRLLVNTRRAGLNGTSSLMARALVAEDAPHRDKLMDGFHIEENAQIWVSPHARVLLTRTENQEFVHVKGYLPEISRYPSGAFELRLATTERYVGDKVVGRLTIRQSGPLEFIAPLTSDARTRKHVLIDLFGTRFDTQGRDPRELSWVLESISLQ